MKLLDFWVYYKRKYPARTKKIIDHNMINKTQYDGYTLHSAAEINKILYNKVMAGNPFMAGRYGSTELVVMRNFDFHIVNKYKDSIEQLQMWSGFFPGDKREVRKFVKLMMKSSEFCDVFGAWYNNFETYYMKKYMNANTEFTFLFNMEPWANPETPWTKALKGKKVLVIHPFEDTIKQQFKKRESIFPGTDILPEFDLYTLKAVQTIAGQQDERFKNWFEALEYMYQEALKIDFDIAILGCGAYGFPLAAKLKKAGKQAVHLGGATQLLFGIKGKRWENTDEFEYVSKYFNENWTYPLESDQPQNKDLVEGGCYWK